MADYWKSARRWEFERRRSGDKPSAPPRREITLTRDLRDPSGSSYSMKPAGRSVPSVGRVWRGQGVPAIHRPPRAWGSPVNFMPRFNPRRFAFDMAMRNYDLFYEAGKALWDYSQQLQRQPVPIDPGSSRPPSDALGPQPDGYQYYMDNPGGWVSCSYQAQWAPGTKEGTFTRFYRSEGHVIGGEPCAWYGGSKSSPISGGPSAGTNTWSMYVGSRFFTQAWRSYRPGTGVPASPYPTAYRVPVGSPAPEIGTPPSHGFMPGAEWDIPWMPNQNQDLPWVWRSVLNEAALALGIRWDSGYGYFDAPATEPSSQVVVTVPPNKPPTIDTGTNPRPPYKPPGTKVDRKARIAGWQAFQLVQGAFHKLTEYQDFEDALYEALPKSRQTCKGKPFGCKTAQLVRYWDEVDVIDAIVNVVANEVQDRMAGRFFGSVDRAARRLGTHGYKLLNPAAHSPMDEAVGEIIGEVTKRFIEPSASAIKHEVKRYFGVL